MHELSIAHHLVEIADQAAAEAQVTLVTSVHLRLGALAGVVKDALLFAYDIAAAGTRLQGSRLEIEDVPIVIYCADCAAEYELPDIQAFRCPRCGAFSADVRQGRELEIVSLEAADEQPTHS
jgi:hydrogenase nickel incorporation protein HypA/HybF